MFEQSHIRKILLLACAVAVLAALVLSAGWLFENVDATETVIIQSPISGTLAFYTSPGIKWQGFGKVTTYQKRASYSFEILLRFNDGGRGTMHGSIQWEMPVDEINLTKLHTKFGSPEAIRSQLIEKTTNKAVYMTGPLMSSKESYAEKRNYLISYVEDQITNGVYRTQSREARTQDPLTGTEKTVTIVDIVQRNGVPVRQEAAVLQEFGIHTFNFAVERLPYDEAIDKQIQQQQQITMDVQTSIAEAKKAEQRKITTEENGKADAAKAKWDQEVIKAKEVTAAEQRKEVAKFDAEAAALTKQKDILLGQGESEKKRLIMSADGALEKKLETWLKSQEVWASAFANYRGALVPNVVMGGSSVNGTAIGSAQTFMDILGAKAAKDLSLDIGMRGSPAAPTAKQ